YLVDTGQIDIFSVRVDSGRPAGRRAHLMRVAAGHALLDLTRSVDRRGFLAVGTAGTRLLHISQPMLLDFAAQPDRLDALRDLVEQWIDALCGAMAQGLPPARSVELESGIEATIPSSTIVRPRNPVAWLEHLEGRSCLLGRPELAIELDGPV